MLRATFLTALLFSSAPASACCLTPTQMADSVDASKRKALEASEEFEMHIQELISRQNISNLPHDCFAYGAFLRMSAMNRIYDADLVMSAVTNGATPATLAQRYSASMIYLAAKRDLDRAIPEVDRCISAGGPFKPYTSGAP